jgi:hypothetical protein
VVAFNECVSQVYHSSCLIKMLRCLEQTLIVAHIAGAMQAFVHCWIIPVDRSTHPPNMSRILQSSRGLPSASLSSMHMASLLDCYPNALLFSGTMLLPQGFTFHGLAPEAYSSHGTIQQAMIHGIMGNVPLPFCTSPLPEITALLAHCGCSMSTTHVISLLITHMAVDGNA